MSRRTKRKRFTDLDLFTARKDPAVSVAAIKLDLKHHALTVILIRATNDRAVSPFEHDPVADRERISRFACSLPCSHALER
jgi:hypothetical protein